jgi:D-amino peptidase
MKIYIMTDMEGISGICRADQVASGSSCYEAARHLLCADVNAAIAGAFEGGATEVLVSDGHGSGFNFLLEEMDERAVYERPNGALNYLPGLDESFAGVFCVGYHAMAGTQNGFLDHTQSTTEWLNYFINNRRTGELGQVGTWAGSYGVPVLLVTGDQAACDEAREFFGEIKTVAVKQGIGRQYARCLHPAKAHVAIRQQAGKAMELVGQITPFRVELPLTIRLELQRSDLADNLAQRPGTRRMDARTVERTVDHERLLMSFYQSVPFDHIKAPNHIFAWRLNQVK